MVMVLKVVATGGCNGMELLIGRLEIYGNEVADHFFVYLTFLRPSGSKRPEVERGRVCSRSAGSKRVCFCPRLLAYFAFTISYEFRVNSCSKLFGAVLGLMPIQCLGDSLYGLPIQSYCAFKS